MKQISRCSNRCTKTIDIDNQIIFRNTIIIISRSKLRIVSEFSFGKFSILYSLPINILSEFQYIYIFRFPNNILFRSSISSMACSHAIYQYPITWTKVYINSIYFIHGYPIVTTH